MISTSILILAGCALFALNYRYRGLDRAIFYEADQAVVHPALKPYLKNRHLVDFPSDLTFFAGIFCFLLAYLLPNYLWFWATVWAALYTVLISLACSAGYQKWINLAFGLPEINDKERRKQEIFLLKKSIWIPHVWGKYRVYASRIASILLIVLTLLLYIF